MADFLTYTSNFLTQNSIINENADSKVITPIIISVQDLYLHPILGTSLFNEIKQQIITDTVSSANQTLLDDHLMPILMWYTLCDVTPAMKYRYMNKGVQVKNSQQSASADLTEIQYLMDQWKNKAEAYAERCTKFLRQNIVTYPLFVYNPNYSDIKPNRHNPGGGIYLGTYRSDDEDCRILIGNY